jgi:AcrR family transcriptional regulator
MLLDMTMSSPNNRTPRALSATPADSGAAPGGRRALRPPDSRDKILEVAEGLFAYGGYAGVGMRQLAATVGLSKSSLFHHFSSKLDLYADVLDRVLERIETGLETQTAATAQPAERLEAWIDAVILTLSEDMPAGRLMMRALVDEEPFPAVMLQGGGNADRDLKPFELRLAGILDRFRGLLQEGIQAGVFRPVSIGDTILSVIGTIVFHFASGDLGEALIGDPIFSRRAVDRRRREVSEFIRRGLLA